MEPDLAITSIAHAIQLAIAPVFLLTGIGSLLSVMTSRLARVIDRARALERAWPDLGAEQQADVRQELATLSHRAIVASWSINLGAFAALLICSLIATLFVEAIAGINLRWLVGAMFIAAMVTLSTGLLCFLREVHVAIHTLRIGPPARRPAA
jgi:hypothetical protein